MKNFRILALALAAIILISSCASKSSKENTVSLSGAFALYPLVVKWADEYKKENPNVRFNISGGGAGKGMADALAGAVDLGMFSREISQEEKDKGVWWVGLTIDAVVPTISNQNSYLEILKKRGLTRDEFKAIFIDKSISGWDELVAGELKNTISVYTRSDACGAAGTWAKYLGGKQENLSGVGIFGDPGLADAVSKDPVGIAFNNTIFAFNIKTGAKRDGIEVIPIDINANGKIDPEEDFYDSFEQILKAIANGIYPAPPARELYFVSKGKPEKEAAIDFIKWTLTKGQAFVKEAGYVPIEQSKINKYLDKLK
ncbi:PstS family phosphate ABC transporter substrate-binding protein [Carboxylicivirga linearis]|uniref:Substrate-binding domain-containing protein n=1 Tax=Carboxylicivirga linearis TaxID=1628157 RepID=A0ABS5JVE8_9BACT|nr:substrate-binding domain-containing protein [Carboxylicivirga linearis]MBS2098871.1 substrate-binding domain-containing protein [Carboxylicivirga linearis]